MRKMAPKRTVRTVLHSNSFAVACGCGDRGHTMQPKFRELTFVPTEPILANEQQNGKKT
jgi:hypothetical protein